MSSTDPAPARSRVTALLSGLALNVLGPLVLMAVASGHPRAFFANPLFATAAALFVLPNLVLVLFTTGYGPHARASGESPWFIASANAAANLGVAAAVLCDAHGWLRLPGGDAWRGPGLVVLALGTALRVLTMLSLGRLFSLRVSVEPDHRLVTSGFYRWVRHPSYTAVIVLCLGIGGVFASGLWMALVPFMVFGLVRRMATEERFLLEHFGDEYRRYMARTSRLIPGVY